jgi:serine/threonine protein phosphatase PrpC
MSTPESLPALRSSVLTDPGQRRELNEDAVFQSITSYGGLFIVADGMGGHRTGEVASRMAVERIAFYLLESLAPSPHKLLEAFERANEAIFEAAQNPESRGMGTTATALWLDLPYALIGHVGDSRAYLLRGGELSQLTEDHSWVAERLRQGLLTEAEARSHRWRNVITNALGSFPRARIDLIGLKVHPGDRFLLCTDGLSSVVDDRTLQSVLQSFSPEEAAAQLVQLANQWGGPDNVSVAVIGVEALPPSTRPSYGALLEAAPSPIRFQLGDPEPLPTQVMEPARNLWQRWGSWGLLALWLLLVLYLLFVHSR